MGRGRTLPRCQHCRAGGTLRIRRCAHRVSSPPPTSLGPRWAAAGAPGQGLEHVAVLAPEVAGVPREGVELTRGQLRDDAFRGLPDEFTFPLISPDPPGEEGPAGKHPPRARGTPGDPK